MRVFSGSMNEFSGFQLIGFGNLGVTGVTDTEGLLTGNLGVTGVTDTEGLLTGNLGVTGVTDTEGLIEGLTEGSGLGEVLGAKVVFS